MNKLSSIERFNTMKRRLECGVRIRWIKLRKVSHVFRIIKILESSKTIMNCLLNIQKQKAQKNKRQKQSGLQGKVRPIKNPRIISSSCQSIKVDQGEFQVKNMYIIDKQSVMNEYQNKFAQKHLIDEMINDFSEIIEQKSILLYKLFIFELSSKQKARKYCFSTHLRGESNFQVTKYQPQEKEVEVAKPVDNNSYQQYFIDIHSFLDKLYQKKSQFFFQRNELLLKSKLGLNATLIGLNKEKIISSSKSKSNLTSKSNQKIQYFILMRKKQPIKNKHSSLKKEKKYSSLCQLSISQIIQLKNSQESLDFSQQREIFCGMINVDSSGNEYGLKALQKKKNIQKITHQKDGTSHSRCTDFEIVEKNKQKEVRPKTLIQACLDDVFKREREKKKKKIKINQKPCYFPKQTEKIMKQIQSDLFERDGFLPSIILPKFPHLKMKTQLRETPITSHFPRNEKICPKVYHLLSEKIKEEIGDINPYFLTESKQKKDEFEDTKKSVLLLSVNSRKSEKSIKEQFNSESQSIKSEYFQAGVPSAFIENCTYHEKLENNLKLQQIKRSSSVNLSSSLNSKLFLHSSNKNKEKNKNVSAQNRYESTRWRVGSSSKPVKIYFCNNSFGNVFHS